MNLIEEIFSKTATRFKVMVLVFFISNLPEGFTQNNQELAQQFIDQAEEVMKATLAHPHYKAPLKGRNRGRGVAAGFWFNAGLKSSVTAAVNPDGVVSLVEGSTDIGGSRTSIAMQLAEVLGIAAEDVKPTVVDTDSVGLTSGTGGRSRKLAKCVFASSRATSRSARSPAGI